MRPKRMKWLGTAIVVMVVMIAGNFAVAVPTTLYDGTIGAADPLSQGFFVDNSLRSDLFSFQFS